MGDWRTSAACGDADLTRFGSDKAYSRALCVRCPVIIECLADAVACDSGEWAAGMTAARRRSFGAAAIAAEVVTLIPAERLRDGLAVAVARLVAVPAAPPFRPSEVVPITPVRRPSPRSSWKRDVVRAEALGRLDDLVRLRGNVYRPLGECTVPDLRAASVSAAEEAQVLASIADAMQAVGAMTVSDLAPAELADMLVRYAALHGDSAPIQTRDANSLACRVTSIDVRAVMGPEEERNPNAVSPGGPDSGGGPS